jgi:flagellin
MPSVINTNLASMFAQNALSGAQKNLSTSVQRLSSGLRINSAADDAAGLSVAQNMQSQINAINMAVRNVGDATNLLTTADSSLSTIQDMLLRMKSLVVEGKNDSLSNAQKGNVNTELGEIRNEINNVATRTTFNGNNLLSNTGTLSISNLVVGASAGTNSSITNVTLTGAKPQAYTISAVDAGGTNKAVRILGADGVSQTVSMITGAAGSSNTYDFNALGIKFTVASTGATADTAVATGIALLGGTVSATGTPTLAFQTGAANADSYSFAALNVLTTGGNNSSADFTDLETSLTAITAAVAANGGAGNNTNVNNEFTTLSGRIDSAINKINTQRATLGSQMNRLSYTNTNLLAQSTNMQNSRSAVIDTDFAKETASLTKGQIMQQAATAMLAQANQMPNVILSLLK